MHSLSHFSFRLCAVKEGEQKLEGKSEYTEEMIKKKNGKK